MVKEERKEGRKEERENDFTTDGIGVNMTDGHVTDGYMTDGYSGLHTHTQKYHHTGTPFVPVKPSCHSLRPVVTPPQK
jgi:hypothetical protein